MGTVFHFGADYEKHIYKQNPANRGVLLQTGFLSGDRNNNKQKKFTAIVPGKVGSKLFYVLPFFSGKKEAHKQRRDNLRGNPGFNPGTIPAECLFVCFLVLRSKRRPKGPETSKTLK